MGPKWTQYKNGPKNKNKNKTRNKKEMKSDMKIKNKINKHETLITKRYEWYLNTNNSDMNKDLSMKQNLNAKHDIDQFLDERFKHEETNRHEMTF